jgi:hypothetical protein
MSFKRLEPEDFLISTDAIVAPAFANGSSTNTAATQGNSGVSADYYTAYLGSDNRPEAFTAQADKTATGTNIAQQVVYKQFANIIQGDAESSLPIGDTFTAIVVDRQRFKQSIFPPTFAIDNSSIGPISTGSEDVGFTNAGRVYSGSNIYFYPDIGTALIDGNPSYTTGLITCDSEEVLTSNFVFIRARNAEFNYSQNPTFIDSTTGGVRFTDFITAPQTFITTVGLYNDNGDLLAVAKLSKPLKKDFTKEALIRVKLDF